MNDEDDLLAALTAALAATARGDVEALLDEAVAEARDDARTALRRLARRAYLEATLAVLAEDDGVDTPSSGTSAEAPDRPAPDALDVPSDEPPLPGTPTMTYVFGVLRADDPLPDPVVAAVRRRVGLRVVSDDVLAAVVRDVPAAPFDDLTEQATDPEWLERQVRIHDAVLRALAEVVDLAPLRFGAVLADDDRVRALLADERSRLTADLDLVRGAQEWGLRIVRSARGQADDIPTDPAGVGPGADPTGDVADPAAPAAGGGGAGATWVATRRAAQAARESERAQLSACVREVTQGLAAAARDAVRRTPRPAAEGGVADTAAEATFLVDRARADEFLDRADRLAHRWRATADVVVTGPWPAYSFVGERT